MVRALDFHAEGDSNLNPASAMDIFLHENKVKSSVYSGLLYKNGSKIRASWYVYHKSGL